MGINSAVHIMQKAVNDAGYEAPADLVVTRPKQEFGDYATPVALSLAKETKQKPEGIAQKIVAELRKNTLVESAESAGPGFINLNLSEQWLEQQLGQDQFSADLLKGRKYIIEYSSPNIAKPMHVGHLRATILGQVLVNLFHSLGGEVTAWSHPGDWGTQFGKLLVAWQKWGDEAALNKHPVDEMLRIYVKFHQEAEKDESLNNEARAALKALQQGDKALTSLWQRFTELSTDEFQQTYHLLGVSFDVWRGESAYNDRLHDLVKKALAAGVAETSEGAIIISLDEQNLPPFLIQKSDGASLYATSDLVSIAERTNEYRPDELIYVVGNDQSLHFQQLFAAAKRLTKAGVYSAHFALPKLAHVSFGLFRLVSGKMSTRKGETIRATDVVDEAIKQAESMLKDKNPDLSTSERQSLAQDIGIAAVKYTDLQHDRHTDVVFDWDKMFSLEGNSIVYLFYANARINSLLKESTKAKPSETKTEGWSVHERKLLFTALELGDALKKSVAEYDPHFLLNHAYALANDFSRFYNSDQILKAPGPVRERRLALTKMVQQQLNLIFDILGVKAPERL